MLDGTRDQIDFVRSLRNHTCPINRQLTGPLRIGRRLGRMPSDRIDAHRHFLDRTGHGLRRRTLCRRPLCHTGRMTGQHIGLFGHALGVVDHLSDNALKTCNQPIVMRHTNAGRTCRSARPARQIAIQVSPL
ncbi:hypothetical protein SDC9_188144 [bioreactor metagenome]|uniref:Uncharacterized protein n=1 Tax=bioreactor metagenome TaxID=1076179 RepID=A0A645HPW4_9ZZZZ